MSNPSVIGSARQSISSMFNVATTTFKTVDQLVTIGASTIDALDQKARTMLLDVTEREEVKRITIIDQAQADELAKHTVAMRDIYAQFKTVEERNAFNEALAKLKEQRAAKSA